VGIKTFDIDKEIGVQLFKGMRPKADDLGRCFVFHFQEAQLVFLVSKVDTELADVG
tara:strand:- start:152 stop:319 length:168 start_codon:yes stop_codon:yes gene_type:complete